jgi:uncharacterized protein YutE (UPF0331/DUF86 family)
MTPVDPAVVRRKLSVITDNLQALKSIEAIDLTRYRADIFTRKGTERLLQELIEAALDLNMHLLAQTAQKLPEDYYQSFILLGEHGILSKGLAAALAPSTGLRNRLVHEYEAIDDTVVIKAVRQAQDLYPQYVAAVERHLEGNHA